MATARDMAEILQLQTAPQSKTPELVVPGSQALKTRSSKQSPAKVSRELLNLGITELPATQIVPTTDLQAMGRVRKWRRTQFTNPRRKDGLKLEHWTRQDDQSTISKFAGYGVVPRIPPLDAAVYNTSFHHPEWTLQETNELLDALAKYGMRLPVIQDRICGPGRKHRELIEIKDRLIMVVSRIQDPSAISADIEQAKAINHVLEPLRTAPLDDKDARKRQTQVRSVMAAYSIQNRLAGAPAVEPKPKKTQAAKATPVAPPIKAEPHPPISAAAIPPIPPAPAGTVPLEVPPPLQPRPPVQPVKIAKPPMLPELPLTTTADDSGNLNISPTIGSLSADPSTHFIEFKDLIKSGQLDVTQIPIMAADAHTELTDFGMRDEFKRRWPYKPHRKTSRVSASMTAYVACKGLMGVIEELAGADTKTPRAKKRKVRDLSY
ncbi:Myb and DNA methyltransferase 1-associated 1 domain containing protein [Carpediemonas membranifera]|uniref:Myb and DNA methyltransferase 1-associated 1 domain containing protein n=1 Tax=Carpediemonas membranifera TaxID=201153 RepID=A0A8J6AQ84_9EUKA|nr:Myb and DNA methyltransferase 1-associated 1 domain containing protein [Carpediemonas membranifera]|eukprot:KAG9391111.1 Myb and DNA methyltransferase 1-associated 1 domain containing protein [Carpediemonas membranifera]